MGINSEKCREPDLEDDTLKKERLDYDPTHFLRCHSKKNDSSDVQTQVWQCAFEPDINDMKKTTSTVATCGGNTVCFIDVKTGIIPLKYYAKDSRELLYALAWTANGEDTFLVCGGTLYSVHVIHPKSGVALFVAPVKKNKKRKCHINSLMFHPQHWNILFCGGGDGEIHICHIGNPTAPEFLVSFDVLQCLSTNTEIFSLTYCPLNNTLLVGCDDGLFGWKFPDGVLDRSALESLDLKPKRFTLPTKDGGSTQDLVDSVEAIGDGFIATKCALHGVIYLWSLTETLNSSLTDVRPTHLLRWSDTDNYYMSIGVQREASMLCCGDDKGNLWLYDLSSLGCPEPNSHVTVQPTVILPWPDLVDPHTEKKRKLSIDTYDIVVDKVAISSDRSNIVAVTNNNMVCVWEKV